jgi:adenylate cyclase
MRYRMKLFILVIALVVISNSLLAWTSYRQCDTLLQAEIHRKARSIAATTAALLDPATASAIRQRSDESRPEYTRLQTQLRRVRDLNRRKDVWVERIFMLVPAPENPRVVEYGADAEERFEYTRHPGDIYMRNGQPVTIGLAGIDKLSENLESFQAGYLSSFAAVADRSGALVAMVGVTLVPAPHSTLQNLGPAILAPFAVTLALTILVAAILARGVTRPLHALQQSIESVGKGDFSAAISVPEGVRGEFGRMAAAISAMAIGLRERDKIKRAFSGYISRQVLDAIMAAGELSALKGERRRVTVMFSDIRGFTTMAEAMRPERVVELLSEYFDRMVEVILHHQGIIDKFLGDGMMVIFGAPLDDPYQEEHAVAAAIEMQQQLAALCRKWEAEGQPAIRMGIGINSGAAVVGNIGSDQRMEYTAIGDTVNLAARLESASKDLGVDIVVSEHTYDAIRSLYRWKSEGEVTVKGRTEPVRTYSIQGIDEKPSREIAG